MIIEGNQLVRVKCLQVVLASKLPECVVQECSDRMRKLELEQNAWQDVITGGEAPTQPQMQMDAILKLKEDAAKSFQGLATMISIAHG